MQTVVGQDDFLICAQKGLSWHSANIQRRSPNGAISLRPVWRKPASTSPSALSPPQTEGTAGIENRGLLIGSRPHKRVSLMHQRGLDEDSKPIWLKAAASARAERWCKSTIAISQCARHQMLLGGIGCWLLRCHDLYRVIMLDALLAQFRGPAHMAGRP